MGEMWRSPKVLVATRLLTCGLADQAKCIGVFGEACRLPLPHSSVIDEHARLFAELVPVEPQDSKCY